MNARRLLWVALAAAVIASAGCIIHTVTRARPTALGQSDDLAEGLAPAAVQAPAAVTDLQVTGAITGSGAVTITLGWTPPAGAFTTTLCHDDAPISEATWAAAQLLAGDLPGSNFAYTGVVSYSGGTRYFALRTQDEAGDWSAVSNNAFWPAGYGTYLPLVLRAASFGGPLLEGCQVFPADHVWNAPVDTLPPDANSDAYINTIGASTGLHPDFGSGTWEGSPIGIPFTVVPGTQPLVDVTFGYDDESDPGPYPIPPDALIEGGPGSSGDRHVLVLDRDRCILYETWDSWPQPDGSWYAGSGAVFSLSAYTLRPDGWTSADAAGLPILPGLVRYDEIAAGEVRHAIRFTAQQTRRAYVWPARHFASSLTGSQYPPMGQRFRLKAGFDTSGFSSEVQVILQAMKTYGIILADNGSNWFVSGVPDERWDNDVLHELGQVHGHDFEAVDVSSLVVDPDSGQAQP